LLIAVNNYLDEGKECCLKKKREGLNTTVMTRYTTDYPMDPPSFSWHRLSRPDLLLFISRLSRTFKDVGQIIFTGIIVGMVTLIGTLGAYAKVPGSVTAPNSIAAQPSPGSRSPSGLPTPGVGWPITSSSGPAKIALARYLKQIGAKEYIAWWCPHCHEQKELFGKEAYSEINHIECAEGGKNAHPDLCQAANVQSFPTWEIKGKSYQGVQSLEELAKISGYTGPRNFKNFTATP